MNSQIVDLCSRILAVKREREQGIKRMKELNEANEKLAESISVCQNAQIYVTSTLDVLYASSIKEAEKLVNNVLQYIFFDKDYSISILMDDRWGKSINFVLQDGKGKEVDLKNGVGAGIRAVVSFIIHYFYLSRVKLAGKRYLFVDEAYTQVSVPYIDRFFSFIKSLAETKDFSLVLITHDTARVVNYADRVYQVADGVVSLAN